MKASILALALAATAAPALAQDAHGDAGEVASIPADDAVLTQAPSAIALTFDHPVVLTKVELHGPGHTDIALAFTAQANAAASYSIPLPAIGSGAYEIHWTASSDGHAMEGVIHFAVQ